MAASAINSFRRDGPLYGFSWGLPVKISKALTIHASLPESCRSCCAVYQPLVDPEPTIAMRDPIASG